MASCDAVACDDMPETAGTVDILHVALAFIGGGVINTTVLCYLFLRMVSIDRQCAELKVHLSYIRREIAYATGTELPELPDPPK